MRNSGLLFLEDENVVALGKSGDINLTVFGQMPLRYFVMPLAAGYLYPATITSPFLRLPLARRGADRAMI